MEEQFTHLICLTYQGKQNGSVLLTNINVRSSWIEYKFFLWQNVWAAQQISLKIVLTFDCGNGETIYTFKLHDLPNRTILSTYEAHTKQLVTPPNYIGVQ